jgi:hypothetical protein
MLELTDDIEMKGPGAGTPRGEHACGADWELELGYLNGWMKQMREGHVCVSSILGIGDGQMKCMRCTKT